MLAGVRDNALLVRLAAAPVEGAANAALLAFLSDQLEVEAELLIQGEGIADADGAATLARQPFQLGEPRLQRRARGRRLVQADVVAGVGPAGLGPDNAANAAAAFAMS